MNNETPKEFHAVIAFRILGTANIEQATRRLLSKLPLIAESGMNNRLGYISESLLDPMPVSCTGALSGIDVSETDPKQFTLTVIEPRPIRSAFHL